jgi:hypothetical protein
MIQTVILTWMVYSRHRACAPLCILKQFAELNIEVNEMYTSPVSRLEILFKKKKEFWIR